MQATFRRVDLTGAVEFRLSGSRPRLSDLALRSALRSAPRPGIRHGFLGHGRSVSAAACQSARAGCRRPRRAAGRCGISCARRPRNPGPGPCAGRSRTEFTGGRDLPGVGRNPPPDGCHEASSNPGHRRGALRGGRPAVAPERSSAEGDLAASLGIRLAGQQCAAGNPSGPGPGGRVTRCVHIAGRAPHCCHRWVQLAGSLGSQSRSAGGRPAGRPP